VWHSYVATVAFSVWQVLALVFYIASSFPMGVQGMRIIAQIVYTALRPFILAFTKCFSVTMNQLLPK
jgi:hypothetical protein